jgi:hypothetical protein
MNWLMPILPYLPPFISICLLGISGISDKYLESLVKNYNTQNSAIEQSKEVIKDIALDCSNRLGFFNSMFISLISCVSISATQEYGVAFITFLVLLLIFMTMFFWINSHQVGELVSMWMRHFKMRKAALCNIILFFVNVCLIIEIFLIQHGVLALPTTSK